MKTVGVLALGVMAAVVLIGQVTISHAGSEGADAGRAAVKRDGVPVYAQMTTSSDVVKTLQRGAMVMVEFSMTGAQGAWCHVTINGTTGYMRCEELEREPTSRWREEPARSPGTARLPREQRPSAREALELLSNKYNPHFWMQKLGFTPQQRAHAFELANETGVTECDRKFQAISRKYGWDPRSKGPTDFESWTKVIREWAPHDFACRSRFAEFWNRFGETMTPKQTAAFEEAQKMIPDIPYLTQ